MSAIFMSWYRNAHGSTTRNHEEVETIQVSMDRQMNKQNAHTIGYYLAIKKSEALTRATVWTKLENLIQVKEARHKRLEYIIPFVWNIQNRHIHQDKRQLSEAGRGGTGSGC